MRNNSVTFLYSGDCNTNGNTLGLAERKKCYMYMEEPQLLLQSDVLMRIKTHWHKL